MDEQQQYNWLSRAADQRDKARQSTEPPSSARGCFVLLAWIFGGFMMLVGTMLFFAADDTHGAGTWHLQLFSAGIAVVGLAVVVLATKAR